MKFLIVDDHRLFSDGLGGLLAGIYPGIEIDREADGRAALRALDARDDYDLMLLDLRLPDVDGLEVLREMAAARLSTPVAVLSETSDYQEIYAALKEGALGFIHKSVDRAELEKAVNAILNGEKYLSDLSGNADLGDAPAPAASDLLTRRQHEVLVLLSEGLLNKQIAARLGASEHTIKIHVSAIMRKFDVRTRTACVNRAMRLGMLRGR